MLGRHACTGVQRFHQVCEGRINIFDNQQGFLDPDQLPKSKSSDLCLLFHPSWNIKWIWSYGRNVLLLICLHYHTHTHTHTHLHTILHSHKPESSYSVFHQNIFWARGQRSVLKAESSLFSLYMTRLLLSAKRLPAWCQLLSVAYFSGASCQTSKKVTHLINLL